MLKWILIFLLIAAGASLFGMPRLAGASATVAQVLIYVVLAIVIIALLFGVLAVP